MVDEATILSAEPAVTVEALDDAPRPTVIANELHVVYRVYGTGSGGSAATLALRRVLRRQASPSLREIHAVRGVTFTAVRGEAIGLIGRNGSGKSTLLRAIAGLLPPESGAVYTEGQPSLLGVNAALLKDLTGDRNIHLGCLAMGMSPEQARDAYRGIVELAGIGDFVSLPMRTYSSGMAARLRFAIAAAKTHSVLMIDEALGTGDSSFRRKSQARIEELRAEAGTVFLVSHNIEAVTESCTRAIWLDEGLIRMDGDVHEVAAAYEEESARD